MLAALRTVLLAGRGVAGGGEVAPPSTALPTVGTAPNAVMGTYRGRAAYGGPLIRIQRADTTQADIGPGVDGYVDVAAVLAFTGGASIDGVAIATIYDQSGAGNDATQATLANMPVLSADPQGRPVVTFGGTQVQGVAGGSTKYLSLPAGYGFNTQALSLFMLGRCAPVGAILAIGGVTESAQLQTNTTGGRRLMLGTSASRTTSVPLHQNTSVVRMVSGASALKIGQDNTVAQTTSVAAAATTAGGRIGNSQNANSGVEMGFRLLALYPAALSDGDANSVSTAMQTIGAVMAKSRVLVLAGDSLTRGTGTTYLKGRAWFAERDLPASVKLYDRGVPSRRYDTQAAAWATDFAGLYDAALSANVVATMAGTNDIAQGQTAAQVQTSARSFMTSARGAGFLVATYALPITGGSDTTAQSFNGLLAADAATYADLLVNLRLSSIGGGQASSPAYYYEATHPNSAGAEVWSGYELAAGLRTLLGA